MNRRPRRTGFTMIELMVVVAIIAVLISLLLPAVQAAREAARRTQCSNNLLQLGVALSNYEATHLVLPPGVVDYKGPIVEGPAAYQFSWISQILPYFEQRNVYNHFDFNVGVYHTNNQTARSVAINVLNCPSQIRYFGPSGGGGFVPFSGPIDPASTAYAACHNDVEAPIDVKNTGVFYLNSRVRFDEIEDGLAHTIFLGEKVPLGDELGWASGSRATLRNTGTPINRTKFDRMDLSAFMFSTNEEVPQPGTGSPEKPAQPPVASNATPITVGGFGSHHPNGSNFLLGDGSVRFLRTSLDSRIYRLLGNRADGQPFGDDQL